MRFYVFVVLLFASFILGGQTLFLPGSKAFNISKRSHIMGFNEDYHSSSITGDFFLFENDFLKDGYLRDVHYLNEIDPNGRKWRYSTKKVLVDSLRGFYRYEDNYREKPESSRNPIFGVFFQQEANFFQVDKGAFSLRLNPMLNISYGRNTSRVNETVFNNQRGLEFYGSIDKRLYFYTNIVESQSSFLPHIEKRIKSTHAIPGQGLYKSFKSRLFDKIQGWDYLNAQGFMGYKLTPSVAIELGHGKQFIGDGMRSLFLSDYAHNRFYVKLRAKFWRINYQTIFNELTAFSREQVVGDQLLAKKYAATHYLTFHVNKYIELGLFESIVFNRANHFEFQYLNPVIFYRAIEHSLGSPDNALLGLSGRINLLGTAQIYSQLVLDEFKLSELRSSTGWWGNKYGLQFGVNYINAFRVPYLDLQIEHNIVRPYTYSHRGVVSEKIRQSYSSYTHYNQPLAHPLGANFRETILGISYRPFDKLSLGIRGVIATTGIDTGKVSFGQNVLVSTDFKRGETGNVIGQGDKTTIHIYDFRASYEFIHNLYVDASLYVRNQYSESRKNDIKSTYFGLGIRYNFIPRKNDY